MDYSVRGMLTMLQDLQRLHFGKVTMYVDVIISDDDKPMVSCSVFDNDGEPHTTAFYTFEPDDDRKRKYSEVFGLINDIIDG